VPSFPPVGRARELEDGADAEDRLVPLRGRQVGLKLDVGQAPRVAAVDQVGWRTTGMIGRLIKFSSSVTLTGTTGWMLSTYWVLLERGASLAP
jgi:hypothetical protein